MARDIFNREVDLGQPLAADATRLLFSGVSNEDLLVQNVQITYAQNINRLWEVGSAKTIFIAGRTRGSITIARVVGGRGVSTEFIRKYGDVCNMAGNILAFTFEAGCTDGAQVGSITASGVAIESIAYTVAASDMIVNEQLTALFARLEV